MQMQTYAPVPDAVTTINVAEGLQSSIGVCSSFENLCSESLPHIQIKGCHLKRYLLRMPYFMCLIAPVSLLTSHIQKASFKEISQLVHHHR